jgi:hypothetical protein
LFDMQYLVHSLKGGLLVRVFAATAHKTPGSISILAGVWGVVGHAVPRGLTQR